MSAKKKIRQLDYFTGEEIRVFNSMRETAEANYMEIQSLQYAFKHNDGVMPRLELKFEFVQ